MKKSLILFTLFCLFICSFSGCASKQEPTENEVAPVEIAAVEEPDVEISAEVVMEEVPSEPTAEATVQEETASDNTVFIHYGVISPTDNQEAASAYNEGTFYLNTFDYANAEKKFLEAIELDPSFIDAWDNLGVAYRRQGKMAEAEEVLLQSISMNDMNEVPYTILALVYCDQNRYQDALNLYVDLLKKIPDSAEGNYGLGNLLYQFSYFENALYYFNRAAQIYLDQESPYLVDAVRNVGLCYYYLNDYETAEKWFQFTLTFISDDTVALKYLNKIKDTE